MSLLAIARWTLILLAWTLALGWVYQWLQWILHFRQVENLTEITPAPLPVHSDQLPSAPELTVIVPACNEAASIETTLRSLLKSVEISVQIIAVNDRSTDQTGAIMNALLEESRYPQPNQNLHNRLEVIHINNLPPNWLGKPHALSTGADCAQAEWLLFTDGDVTFDPLALRRALSYAIQHGADHLVVMPDWTMKSAGEAAMHGAMHALSTWTLRLWNVADPAKRDFIGVGAFNLIRKSTYESVGGFTALRQEVIEDMRLGWLVKRAGFRQRVAVGPGLAAVRWSEGAWGVVRNLEKNLFAVYRFRTGTALVAMFGLAVQIVLPLAALWVGGPSRWAAMLQFAAIAGIYISASKVTRVRPIFVVAYPVAAALFLFAHFRSVGLALWRGGVMWRGTLYPLAELRKNAGDFW